MASRTDVFTIPPIRFVVAGETATIGIDFANFLATGESVTTTVGARIFNRLTRIEVVSAVTAAARDGTTTTQVNVSYDATDLSPATAYRLETSVMLNTGKVRILVTDIEVV